MRTGKNIFVIVLASLTLLYTTPACASEHLLEGEVTDTYSWERSDENQKRVAVGMTVWGIAISIATIIVFSIVPISQSKTASTGKATSGGGGGLF